MFDQALCGKTVLSQSLSRAWCLADLSNGSFQYTKLLITGKMQPFVGQQKPSKRAGDNFTLPCDSFGGA